MTAAPPERIGPGRLVLVVGPSGAGKDTVIGLARTELASDTGVVFPRRVITRPSSQAEDHATVSVAAFDEALSEGAFAFWWEAHGLKYALPIAVNNDIRAGRTAVCNVSRAIIADLRQRYASVIVVLVTAPPDVLRQRLGARERASDGSIDNRISRSAAVADGLEPDVTIENVGAPADAARRLIALLTP